jgi:hypothetical protein
MNYFKYTNGLDFTIGNIPYTGFLNVVDGVAYTGRSKTDSSEKLTPTGTFLSEFFLQELEFDTTANITETFSNVFDLFNKQELGRFFNTIDTNNLEIFKKLIAPNHTLINLNTATNFFGLSSTPVDIAPDDVLSGKTKRMQIDPFSYSDDWGFLDEVKYGVLLGQTDDNFIYISSNGYNLSIIEGNFYSGDVLSVIKYETYDTETIYGIHYDDVNKEVLIQYGNNVTVYDSTSWKDCQVEIVSSSILLNGNFSNNDNVKFGKNYKISIKNNNLYVEDKYSTKIINTIYLNNYDITDISSFDIRITDDLIGILFGGRKLVVFDALDFDNRVISTLNDFTDVDNEIPEIENNPPPDDKKIIFGNFDSGVIFTTNYDEVQLRSLANPSSPISKSNRTTFNYIRNYKFDDTQQKFGSSILKWNSNTLKSNYFNNLLFFNGVDAYHNYYLFHNIGRIYPIKISLLNSYRYSINDGLMKKYTGVRCSDSSIGIFFNINMSNLLADLLTIYNKAKNTYDIDNGVVILKEIREINIEKENLFLNINETINVVSIQRIFSKIIDIQRSIISLS